MNDVLKTIAVLILAAIVGVGGAMLMEAYMKAAPNRFTPAVEASDTDDLTAGRYHQRTRTNDFFRKGRG